MTKSRRHGFTLLEVMIAMAILSVALTALFSSEAGAVKMAYRARRMGVATLLARCKMGEIEEQVAMEGLPAVSDVGSDGCCEDAEVEGFTCAWEIERIVLPDTMFAPEDDDADALANAPTTSTPGTAGGPLGTDPMSLLSGATGSMAGGGMGSGFTGMAMSYALPILKPYFEEQIRRATVTVTWSEGSRPHSFDVTQYLVAEQPLLQDPNAATGASGGATSGTGTPTPNAPATSPGGGRPPQAPGGLLGGGLLGGGLLGGGLLGGGR